MSLEFYCRWSSTVAYKEIFKNYLKYWGSIVGGVLLSYCFPKVRARSFIFLSQNFIYLKILFSGLDSGKIRVLNFDFAIKKGSIHIQ